MSTWSDEIAKSKLSELSAGQQREAKELSDRQLLTANADRMWRELREAIQSEVKDVNESMKRVGLRDEWRIEETAHHDAMIIHAGQAGNIQYDAGSWSVSTPAGSFRLAPRGTKVVWLDESNKEIGKNQIARLVLESIVR